jgi:hypothetical protein
MTEAHYHRPLGEQVLQAENHIAARLAGGLQSRLINERAANHSDCLLSPAISSRQGRQRNLAQHFR